MANGYSLLSITVTADMRQAYSNITQGAVKAGDEAAQTIGQRIGAGLKSLAPVGAAVFKGVGNAIAATTVAATGFGVAAFMTAARVGEMDATLRALAKSNNQSYPAMQKQVATIRAQGIEYGVAQQVVAQFSRNQLDLAKSSELARVAQDAAVISGRNSTEVLSDMIHGITTQNSLVLRNAGVNVQAGAAMDAYAKSLGKTTAQLTDSERATAVLNATLDSGKSIAGAYAEAMTEPGKVLRSFPRIIDDIKVSIGAGLVKAFGPAILSMYDLTKAFSKAIEPGGKLAPVFDAIGVAAAKVAEPINAALAAATSFLENLSPSQIDAITQAISRFGPAIAVAAGAITLLSAPGLLGGLPVIGPLLTSLIKPAGMLAGVLLKLASTAGPLGALGPVAAAIAAAFAILMIVSPQFRAAVMSVVAALSAALGPALAAVVKAALPVGAILLHLARTVGDTLAPAFAAFVPLIGPVGSILTSLITIVGGLVKVLALVLAPMISLVGAVTRLYIVNVMVPYLARMAQALAILANAIATVVKWILGGSPGLIPAFLALQGVIGGVMGSIVGIAVAGFNAIASAVRAAHSAITSTVSSAWSRIRSVITSGVNGARSAVQAGASAMLSVIRSMASGFASSGAAAGNALRSSISSGINAARSAVTSAVQAMIAAARSLVGGFASAGAAAASAMAGAIRGGLAGLVGQVKSQLAGIVNAAKSALKIGSPSKIMWDIGRDFTAGFLGGMLSLDLGAAAGHMFAGLPATVAGPALAGGEVPSAYAAGPGPLAPLGGGQLAGLGSVTVNVYPQAGQSETEIAAAVSRQLGWALATGRA